MKFLFFVLLFISANLFAQLSPSWSHKYIGPIKQIKLIDIDNDQKNEIVASGESGIITLDDNGSLLWYTQADQADTLIPMQYDGDIYPEIAMIGWNDIKIFDNNGSLLDWKIFSNFSTSRLPYAVLGNRLVSFYEDSQDNSNSGLIFIDEYSPFYTLSTSDKLKDELASVDIDGD